ncbi:MAG: penicillin-binding transpeptidase domain-containing protein [Firmicutes bacterium]|nr:penicillin-binding transpeptidase domain-containing protein [Bacillota bacterium]
MNGAHSKGRSNALRVGFVVLLAVLVTRISYVQEADVKALRSAALSQWDAVSEIVPMRGAIYDANGDRLAFDMPAYDIDLYLPGIQSAGTATMSRLATGIAQITGGNESFVAGQLQRSDGPWIQVYPTLVNVPLALKDQIVQLFAKLNLSTDVSTSKIYDRIYPGGRFASEVIGFDDQAGQGVAGIELEYNRYLQGAPGEQYFQQDAAGNPIPFHPVVTKPVANGDSVYLTIDASIQHYAEQALALIKKRFTPTHAVIIVADPNTGAILAMATLPNFNPNHYWTFPSSTLDTNWAISAPFEPGSTFKLVTMVGALATHSINLNQTYMSGVDYVSGVPIHDWQPWGWGRITYREAMLLSSNVGFIHIGQAEGEATLYHYIHQFGMDQPTGIDLPGEGDSIRYPLANLNPVDFATMTFGQGISVTPIQQIQEVDAVANGGKLLTPYVVQKVVSPSGKIVYYRAPRLVRQVAPAAIMKTVSDIMVQDVTQGIDTAAAVPGYEVAGKTGTANIPNGHGGYYQNRYNLSFIGFVPANHPELAMFVSVSDPHNTIQYGNDVSSPAARYVMEKALQYLRIPPNTGHGPSAFADVTQASYRSVPNVVGLSIPAATKLLKTDGFAVLATEAAGRATLQWPQAGQHEAQGGQVVLASSLSTSLSGRVRAPHLVGLPMVEAISMCALLGIELDPIGDGYVVSQSVQPGHLLPMGSTMTARFAPYTASN